MENWIVDQIKDNEKLEDFKCSELLKSRKKTVVKQRCWVEDQGKVKMAHEVLGKWQIDAKLDVSNENQRNAEVLRVKYSSKSEFFRKLELLIGRQINTGAKWGVRSLWTISWESMES